MGLSIDFTEGEMLFQRELEVYEANRKSLVAEHDGKTVAIKGEEILGVFDDDLRALLAVKKDHPVGTFLLQKITATKEVITVVTPGVTPGAVPS